MIRSLKYIIEDHQEEVIYATNRQVPSRVATEIADILYIKKIQNYQKQVFTLLRNLYSKNDIRTKRKSKKQAN
jgi:phosphoribosyl-ATP pyrophosphohydrolase